MHFSAAATSLALLAATCNAAALGERQVGPGVIPFPSNPITCIDWNPKDDDHPRTCGTKEGRQTYVYCLNGRICVNLEGGDGEESDLKYWADQDRCHCPDDCTTDGDGNCVY